MRDLFNSSEYLMWNFNDITDADRNKNMEQFFADCEREGLNPRQPQIRQLFNNNVLRRSEYRYLIGRYLEDRSHMLADSHIVDEGRTFHLAMDIFSLEQEEIFAPVSGEIVRSEYEEGDHGYGYYLILRPDDENLPYIFFGHLASDIIELGRVEEGQRIAKLGRHDDNENGGWTIHLHLQLLTELPPEGEAPIGYTSLEDMDTNKVRFPDPQSIFTEWNIER